MQQNKEYPATIKNIMQNKEDHAKIEATKKPILPGLTSKEEKTILSSCNAKVWKYLACFCDESKS